MTIKTTTLTPHQIITLNDYPIYNAEMLRLYFYRCLSGQALPLVPVIRKAIVRQYFTPELARELEAFERINPLATYFMLDGSHRTTALTLTGHKINVIVYATDANIAEARRLVVTGQVLDNGTLAHSLAENCVILRQHFQERTYFMTVQHKTEKLIRDNYIAQYGLPNQGVEDASL
ncbi:MAG: hypothetical protein JXA33_03685 [Anaerolineae bacterium]|nr:hypothetical protein [Anaerolineae bacterium]